MSLIWNTLIDVETQFEEIFYSSGKLIHEPGMDRFEQPGWINRVWTSDLYRRAHIDVVDARETKRLWMMHCCVFPHLDNPAPIFGFDIIAGKGKITGCFHDFSPTGDMEHSLIKWFRAETESLNWKKHRDLPEWARSIFSNAIVAAGNINDETELVQISLMACKNLHHYIQNINLSAGLPIDTTISQNFYCQQQKLNPHTPKVMTSLGLSNDDVQIFIQDCLFPEIIPLETTHLRQTPV